MLHAKAENWLQAHQVAFKTVSLVPLLAPRSLENSDKQDLLTEVVNLASDAAATALNAAKTSFDAIQALELGRGVITGSLNEMRVDMSDLQQKHPQLAKEFIDLQDQFNAPMASTQHRASQRYDSSQKLNQTIHRIRQLPDFERFLLAPSEDELKTAAKSGPIIVVNVSSYRCDALIIEKTQIRALRLPHLHASGIRDRTTKSLGNPKTLEWLWETIARPILDTLGLSQTPTDGYWPHIWWIPTGSLARFPIHAAGYHSQRSPNTVIDRAISSYNSSVKAILHGQRYHTELARTPRPEEVIMVAMQTTPERTDLRFVTKEIDELEKLYSSQSLEVAKPSPHKEQILDALDSCKIFHFAGHGYTHPLDPSKSYLLLADWKTAPLTVASLLEKSLQKQKPFLAYLSACGTGQIIDDKFIDESIHLISAYQLAGFRHVIGTLWEVDDESCVAIARITHEEMRDGDMTDESVYRGLHRATRELRDRWLSTSAKTRRKKRSLKAENIPSTKDMTRIMSTDKGDQKNDTLPRKATLCYFDDEDLHWVPYVHFGV